MTRQRWILYGAILTVFLGVGYWVWPRGESKPKTAQVTQDKQDKMKTSETTVIKEAAKSEEVTAAPKEEAAKEEEAPEKTYTLTAEQFAALLEAARANSASPPAPLTAKQAEDGIDQNKRAFEMLTKIKEAEIVLAEKDHELAATQKKIAVLRAGCCARDNDPARNMDRRIKRREEKAESPRPAAPPVVSSAFPQHDECAGQQGIDREVCYRLRSAIQQARPCGPNGC